MWFRHDLRLADNPALVAASGDGSCSVIPLYVVDPIEWGELATPALAYRKASLQALSQAVGGLHVVRGNPIDAVPALAAAHNAIVHASADFTPDGIARDAAVAERTSLDLAGSAYAVPPGRITKSDGSPYQVFTPFYQAWLEHGWRSPPTAADIHWLLPEAGDPLPELHAAARDVDLPPAGESAARQRWLTYHDEDLDDYAKVRDLPGADRTSRMSIPLAHGELHPRTLLADLRPDDSAFRRELAFRDFYADALFHRPWTAWGYYNRTFEKMDYDSPGPQFEAWKEGRTGFPIVDAGMRQLLKEGWMHNRVRMIVASFLVKDLHLEWQHGARHFLSHLIDADLASNQHGWQWVAGCGTDAAPYFRIFNPTLQGKKFDPNGDYIRRFVPELADLAVADIHEPWLLGQPPADYPPPLVDHAEERQEALRRLAQIQ